MGVKITYVLCLVFFVSIVSETYGSTTSKPRTGRFFLSWLLGVSPCDECPPHFCDDDPAIIHGYCCGCARGADYLPVECSPFIKCPINNYELCRDYEYMMDCCCT